MKKVIFIVLALGLSISGESQDTSKEFYNNAIKMGVFQLFDGGLEFNYERRISENTSCMIGGEFYSNKKSSGDVQSYSGELQYRYYLISPKDLGFKNSAIGGVYVCPSIMFRHWVVSNYNTVYDYVSRQNEQQLNGYDYINNLSCSFIMGVKFNILERVTADFSFGGGTKFSSITDNGPKNTYNTNIYSIGYTGIAPTANFTVGFNF